MEKNSLIRKIYLYLFTIIGLVLLVIGSVNFINMGLKAWVFTQADGETSLYNEKPVEVPTNLKKEIVEIDNSKDDVQVTLTKQQADDLQYLLQMNTEWQAREKNFDPVVARRHRDAAQNLAMIIVGFPLYLFHWLLIKKETKV